MRPLHIRTFEVHVGAVTLWGDLQAAYGPDDRLGLQVRVSRRVRAERPLGVLSVNHAGELVTPKGWEPVEIADAERQAIERAIRDALTSEIKGKP